MSDPSETEAFGYKRPPNKTQFKPGQSGNPRGRPKRPKLDMSVTLNTALNAKIIVTNLGTTKTGLEAFTQTIVDRVLRGDAKGIPDLMKLFEKAKIFKLVDDPTHLTGVVVGPPEYWRDKQRGVQKGYYPLGEGRGGLWIDPVTKETRHAAFPPRKSKR
jgi:Family of unknown function (DUF5681)